MSCDYHSPNLRDNCLPWPHSSLLCGSLQSKREQHFPAASQPSQRRAFFSLAVGLHAPSALQSLQLQCSRFGRPENAFPTFCRLCRGSVSLCDSPAAERPGISQVGQLLTGWATGNSPIRHRRTWELNPRNCPNSLGAVLQKRLQVFTDTALLFTISAGLVAAGARSTTFAFAGNIVFVDKDVTWECEALGRTC
jgi:hypothetical protein